MIRYPRKIGKTVEYYHSTPEEEVIKLLQLYWTDLVYQGNNKVKREKQLGHFMRRYNKLSKYACFELQPKSQDELNYIFEEYRKRLEDREILKNI